MPYNIAALLAWANQTLGDDTRLFLANLRDGSSTTSWVVFQPLIPAT